MMRKASPDTDQISRSFLQKAVRRGNTELVEKTIQYIIANDDFDWLRSRLAVMTFEECWNYGLEVSYDKDETIIKDHYIQLTKFKKNKDAAGLGSLAYNLSEGDISVLFDNKGDKAIKIIAEAIKRPKDFWAWVHTQAQTERQIKLVEMADKGFRKAGWPWDRAFAQSGAYLAVTTEIPELKLLEKPNIELPFWVGIDKHTPKGKEVIREAAKKIGFNANKALWLSFYFESALCNGLEPSHWWDREVEWRMRKLELDIEKGYSIWQELRPIVIELLEEESDKLASKINNSYIFKQTLF